VSELHTITVIIGDSLLVKAICEATGRKRDAVEEDYKREGDLGLVALLSRTSQKTLSFASKPKPLAATFVLEQLRKITETKGENAQSRKVNIIKALMIRCQGSEAKYIVRSLQVQPKRTIGLYCNEFIILMLVSGETSNWNC